MWSQDSLSIYAKALGVPSLPAEYQERPAEQTKMIHALCQGTDQATSVVAVRPANTIVGALGLGGIGKSLITAWLCHHPNIQQQFSDGIHWLTVGDAFGSLLSLQKRLLGRLIPKLETREAIDLLLDKTLQESGEVAALQEGAVEIEKLLANKKYLIVLDDVWQAAIMQSVLPLRCIGQLSRVVVTSRKHDILPTTSHPIEIGLLSDAESIQLLCQYAGCQCDSLQAEAQLAVGNLAALCGGHAFALGLCGSILKQGQGGALPTKAKLEALKQRMEANLASVQTQHGEYKYRSIEAVLQVSWDDLRQETHVPIISMTIEDWLSALGLAEYYSNFIDGGFTSTNEVLEADLKEKDLKESLGIKTFAHLRKLSKSIAAGLFTKVDTHLQEVMLSRCIFPEDSEIPVSTLLTLNGVVKLVEVTTGCTGLWSGGIWKTSSLQYDQESEESFHRALQALAGRSMVILETRRVGFQDEHMVVGLHDLMLRFVQDKASQEQLHLLHLRLLKVYDLVCGCTEELTAVDSYLNRSLRWVMHHISQFHTVAPGCVYDQIKAFLLNSNILDLSDTCTNVTKAALTAIPALGSDREFALRVVQLH